MGILMSGASVFLFAWSFNSLDNYMVSKLYEVTCEDDPYSASKLKAGSVGNMI